MVSRRTSGYLVIAATFAIGVACGGGAAFAISSHRHAAILRDDRPGESRRLRILVRRLDLDAEQEQRVRALLDEDRDKMRDLGRQMFEKCGEPLREQKTRVDAAIRAVLRPEQQRRYDALLERRDHLRLGPSFFGRRGDHEPR